MKLPRTFALAALCLSIVPCRAATPDDVLFRVAFDGNVNAEIARGLASPKALEGKPRFEPGRFGQALVAGEGGSAIAYRIESNLDVKQGSLSMWLLPVNWQPGEKRAHMLFQFTEASVFRLFMDETGDLVFEVGPDLAERRRVAAPLHGYEQNQWLHIVATWSSAELKLYLNGRLAASGPCEERFLPLVLNYNFQVGDLPHGRGRETPRVTRIDDLTIYRRPLGPHELERVESSAAAIAGVDEPPLIVLPRRDEAITIDGVIDAHEWRQAVTVSGFQNVSDHKLTALQTVARFAYDEQNLYFAVESPVLPGIPLRAEHQNRDDHVWNDDAVQLYLAPPGNVRYHMVVNPAGVIFDRKTIVGIDHDSTWNGNWRIASRLDDLAWRLEGAIAFSELEVSPPVPGETWKVNITRDRVEPKNLSCWAPVDQYSDVDRHGELRFTESGPWLGVPLLGSWLGGKLATDIHADPDAGLAAQLLAARGGAALLHRSIPLEQTELHLREPLEAAPDAVQLRITDAADTPLFQQTVFPGDTAGLTVNLLPIPSLGIARVSLRERDAAVLAAKPQAVLQLISESGETVRELRFDTLDNGSAGGEIGIADLPAGRYMLHARLVANGQVVAEGQTTLVKPEEPWRDQHVGVSAAVPPPWTPMHTRRLDDGSLQIDCWNRTHSFSGPLPSRIRNGDAELLARPMTLNIVSQGKALPRQPGKIDGVQTSDAKVSFDAAMTFPTSGGGAIDAKARTYMEFDGMMWTDITLTPREALEVEGLDLVIPIDARYATLKHVPGDILLTGNTGREDGWTWDYSARRFFLWMGNEDLGLTWFYERPEQTRFAEPEKFVRLERRGEVMNFIVQYVGKPITLKEPITLSFGMQATPVRDRPAGWRSWGAPRPVGDGGITIPWTTEHIDRYGGGYPEATSPAFYSRFVEHQKRHGKVVPYKIMLWHGIQSPEWQYHQADWSLGGGINKYHDTRRHWWGERVCGGADSFIDFITWKMMRHLEDHPLDGLYHDLQWSYRCSNPYHGCAPARRAIRGDREMNKRLYTAMKQIDRPTWKIDHPSASTCSIFSGFSDLNVTGEEIATSTKPQKPSHRVWDDYFDGMRISYFKAGGGMGRQWGVAPMFLLQLVGGAPPGATEGIYSILLAHDAIPTWDAYARDSRFQHRLWRALDAFGIGAADVQFLPYWHDTTPVKVTRFIPDGGGAIRPVRVLLHDPEPYDLLQENESYGASVYHRPGQRSLIVVFNYTEDDGVARLKIDPAALGFDSGAPAAMDGFSRLEAVALSEYLDIHVKRRNFRLVWLERVDGAVPATILPDEPQDVLLAGIRPDFPERLAGADQQIVGDRWENAWRNDSPHGAPQQTQAAQIFTLAQPASMHRIEVHMTDAGIRGTHMREALRMQLVRIDNQLQPGEVVVDEDGFVVQEVHMARNYRQLELKQPIMLDPGRYAILFNKPAEDAAEGFHSLLTSLPAEQHTDHLLVRELPGGVWQERPHILALSIHGYQR